MPEGFLKDFDVEQDEEILAYRRELFGKIPPQLLPSIEKIIAEMTDQLNLHRKRTDVGAAISTERQMLDQHVQQSAKKTQTPSKLQQMMKKKKPAPPLSSKKLQEQYEDDIRQILSEEPYSEEQIMHLMKEIMFRAFKDAVKRSDRAHFLMRENF